MAIQEQGFDRGVNLAQKGLNEIRRIGGNLEKMGNTIEDTLNERNYQELSSGSLKELETFAENELKKPDDQISVDGFTKAYETQRNLITDGARNHIVRKRLENQIDSVYESYSKKLSSRRENYDKKVFNTGVLDGINTRMKESSLFLSQGNTDGATNSYNEAINAIDTLNISELEKENIRKQVKSNYRLNKMDSGITGFYDGVKNNIDNPNTDEAFINEKAINDTSEAFNFAIDDPESNKEFWESYGFEVKENKIIDPETGDFYSAEELEKLKARNSQLQADALNKYNYNNSVKIQEKDLLIKNFQESQITGKPINDLELDIFENTYSKYFNENDIEKLKTIKEDKQILSINNFNDRNKAIEDIKKEDLFRAKILEEKSIKRQAFIMQDPSAYFLNNQPDKFTDLNLDTMEPEVYLNEIQSRTEYMNEKSKEMGFELNRFSDKETKHLIDKYNNATGREKEFLYTNVISGMTKKERENFGQKAFTEDGAESQFLQATSTFDLYTEKGKEEAISLLNTIENGRSIREQMGKDIQDGVKNLKNEFSIQFMDNYDSVNSRVRMKVDQEKFMNAYISLAANSGKLDDLFSEDGTLDEELVKKAYKMVAGNTMELNDKQVFTPNINITGDQMKARLLGLNRNNASIINNLPDSVSVNTLIDNLENGGWTLAPRQITGVSDVVYEVQVATGAYLQSKDGGSYKLALSDINNDGVEYEEVQEETIIDNITNVLAENAPADVIRKIKEEPELLSRIIDVSLPGVLYNYIQNPEEINDKVKYYTDPVIRGISEYDYKGAGETIDKAMGIEDAGFFEWFLPEVVNGIKDLDQINLGKMNIEEEKRKKLQEEYNEEFEILKIYKESVFKDLEKEASFVRKDLYNDMEKGVQALYDVLSMPRYEKTDYVTKVALKNIKQNITNYKTKVSKRQELNLIDFDENILGTLNFALNPENWEKKEDKELSLKILKSYLDKEGK